MSDTEQTIKILAIESSCDETAAAVVVNGDVYKRQGQFLVPADHTDS